MDLIDLLATKVASGLKRTAIKKVSEWSESYRIMGQPYPGPWTFNHHPWLREMCDSDCEHSVGQKSAQMGYTEVALNKTFKAIDIDGKSVLYMLPASTPDASDFSSARFDPALEASPHLQDLFTDVKNIGHKRAGNANLYIRGSRSRSQLKSIPVGLLIVDEKDEMIQQNVPLAMERMSGQVEKEVFEISTPTITGHGINITYNNSTQDHFFFKCPHCSKWTELVFPDCLIMTAEDYLSDQIYGTHLICKECKGVLEHQTKPQWLKKGQWISSYTDRIIRGFYINQLYSMTVKPYELAVQFLKGQTNEADEQEFYNSKMGLPHESEGSRVTNKNLQDCEGLHISYDSAKADTFITMGVDVGPKWLHYEIDQWHIDDKVQTNDVNLAATARLIKEGKVQNFEELDIKMRQYNINYCVIDANPERRKAFEFAQRFFGIVKMCFYGRGITGKNITVHLEEEQTVTVDRTSWMDMGLGRFRSGKIILPRDLSNMYKIHVKTPVRVTKKDADGNPVARYIKNENDQDHAAHSRTYSEIALNLAVGLGSAHDIGGIY